MKKLIGAIITVCIILSLAFTGVTEIFAKKIAGIEKIPSFSCKDLKGNKVTDAILKDKKLTMLVLWGTF